MYFSGSSIENGDVVGMVSYKDSDVVGEDRKRALEIIALLVGDTHHAKHAAILIHASRGRSCELGSDFLAENI